MTLPPLFHQKNKSRPLTLPKKDRQRTVLLDLSRKGIIELSPEAARTLERLSDQERQRERRVKSLAVVDEEGDSAGEELRDSFTATDRRGRSTGPTLGEIRRTVAG